MVYSAKKKKEIYDKQQWNQLGVFKLAAIRLYEQNHASSESECTTQQKPVVQT